MSYCPKLLGDMKYKWYSTHLLKLIDIISTRIQQSKHEL